LNQVEDLKTQLAKKKKKWFASAETTEKGGPERRVLPCLISFPPWKIRIIHLKQNLKKEAEKDGPFM